jgi:hypothetical protein
LENGTRLDLIRSSKFLTKAIRKLGPVYPEGVGGAVGRFMQTIRQADLNVIAAEYVGTEGRTVGAIRTKTVLASKDPVALDYYGAKNVLLAQGGPRANYNDPDNTTGPFRRYLESCCAEGIGTLDEGEMVCQSYDFSN